MAGEFAHRGQHILKATEVGGSFAGGNHAGPVGEHWGPNAALMHITLVAAQAAGGIPKCRIVPAFLVRAVVAGEHHQRVVVDAQLREQREHFAHFVVEMLHHRGKPRDGIHHIRTRLAAGTVSANFFVELRKHFAPFRVQLRRRVHRRVRDGGGDVTKKRLLRRRTAPNEIARVLHQRPVNVRTFFQRNLPAIVHRGGGIIRMGDHLAFPAVIFIEPVAQGIGRARQMRVAEAPLAKRPRAITGRLEHLRQHRHLRIQCRLVFVAQIPAHKTMARMLARHQHRSARRTNRVARIMRRKLQALLREPINVRRLKFFLPVTRQIAIAKVVGKNVNDIRFPRRVNHGRDELRNQKERSK